MNEQTTPQTESLTPQQIFDEVTSHLLKQGHKAINSNGHCVYRAPNGDRCAAGCLIPNELYNEDMEGVPISDVIVTNFLPSYFQENVDLIRMLQEAHDIYFEDVNMLKEQLKYIANEYNLNNQSVFE